MTKVHTHMTMSLDGFIADPTPDGINRGQSCFGFEHRYTSSFGLHIAYSSQVATRKLERNGVRAILQVDFAEEGKGGKAADNTV